MHQVHVMQANKGCDFDFLQRGGSQAEAGEPEIH
jgi:dihydroxy-acid dehydratase